jgi:hypothetical protein
LSVWVEGGPRAAQAPTVFLVSESVIPCFVGIFSPNASETAWLTRAWPERLDIAADWVGSRRRSNTTSWRPYLGGAMRGLLRARAHAVDIAEGCTSPKAVSHANAAYLDALKAGGLTPRLDVGPLDPRDLEACGNDRDYLYWTHKNPHGYVVNCYRNPTPDYLMLHWADCYTINGSESQWTTGDYAKVCSPNVAALEDWAAEIGGPLQKCEKCWS